MLREIHATILKKEYDIICEVGTKAVDLNSIINEMEKIIGYKIKTVRFKKGKIIGVLVDESKPIE